MLWENLNKTMSGSGNTLFEALNIPTTPSKIVNLKKKKKQGKQVLITP